VEGRRWLASVAEASWRSRLGQMLLDDARIEGYFLEIDATILSDSRRKQA
jgi:hypothetical protein